MASKVYHGPRPRWGVKLQPGRYECVIHGRYTHTPGLTANGVRSVTWNSKRKVKRQAELLGMRTAFVCWFVSTYTQLGGTHKAAVEAITKYPWRRLRKQIKSGKRGMRYMGDR